MSIYDRDYMRRDPESSPGLGTLLLIVAAAAAILSVVMIAGERRGPNSSGADYLAKRSLRVNINSATEAELETLPGVGPATAHGIAARRPYQRVEQLRQVTGIGARTLEGLRSFAKTDGETERLNPR